MISSSLRQALLACPIAFKNYSKYFSPQYQADLNSKITLLASIKAFHALNNSNTPVPYKIKINSINPNANNASTYKVLSLIALAIVTSSTTSLYPGMPGKFVHSNGGWKLYNSGGPLCRYLELKNTIHPSLFNEIRFYGYRDGTISIKVIYPKTEYSQVESYLKEHNIILQPLLHTTCYQPKTLDQTQTLVKILIENNEIPPEYLDLMHKIISTGSTGDNLRPILVDHESKLALIDL